VVLRADLKSARIIAAANRKDQTVHRLQVRGRSSRPEQEESLVNYYWTFINYHSAELSRGITEQWLIRNDN